MNNSIDSIEWMYINEGMSYFDEKNRSILNENIDGSKY